MGIPHLLRLELGLLDFNNIMSKSDGRKPHTNDVCKEPNKVALPWSSSNNFEKKKKSIFDFIFSEKIYIYIGFFLI
jgi:hypothetical protein